VRDDAILTRARGRSKARHDGGREMQMEPGAGGQDREAEPPSAREPVESRSERLRRHGRRGRLYASAIAAVALLVIVIALVVENTRQVKLSWVIGTTHASLVWIIVAAAILGWLLGIVTSVIFRLRTRRRPSGRGARASRRGRDHD
jgi:uncharacterized integral membrane protein